jgi:hypothetical protein
VSEHLASVSGDSSTVSEHRGRVSEDSGGVIEHSDEMSEHSNKVSEHLEAVRELFASVGLDSSTMCRYCDTNREDIPRRALV